MPPNLPSSWSSQTSLPVCSCAQYASWAPLSCLAIDLESSYHFWPSAFHPFTLDATRQAWPCFACLMACASSASQVRWLNWPATASDYHCVSAFHHETSFFLNRRRHSFCAAHWQTPYRYSLLQYCVRFNHLHQHMSWPQMTLSLPFAFWDLPSS